MNILTDATLFNVRAQSTAALETIEADRVLKVALVSNFGEQIIGTDFLGQKLLPVSQAKYEMDAESLLIEDKVSSDLSINVIITGVVLASKIRVDINIGYDTYATMYSDDIEELVDFAVSFTEKLVYLSSTYYTMGENTYAKLDENDKFIMDILTESERKHADKMFEKFKDELSSLKDKD